ncbi:MAG: bifunctional proline dehydrogenase/L-glutamate gamma-semialdehyde dehydrogenase PutA [Fluviicoccus sp.]|uniref:bifunctional proline dehydrogenase/L-glutamate gamma-semialdehyde dehydrogenase PutA n=1 Tax=Fluviicoccus sp. TaxID=2003552 RepID=UPI002715B1FF|nr:bifunctional proline dehydrogenase/L-glutamate gamma-semialdehyde dehydrogenase PutA [Fluviicoccus sp.]MDO8329403.1 bifunctional proline dehydrogenase/L-glutamate gamma-semialdehyde dehydrogenase PutA [Fluviicoccus sp.]
MIPLRDLPEFPCDFRTLRDSCLADEALVLTSLLNDCGLDHARKAEISTLALQLVNQARHARHPAFQDFIQTYRIDTREGRTLLTLAESLLRIPDAHTRNELINSLLPGGEWEPKEDENRTRLVNWAGKLLARARRFVQDEDRPDPWHQMVLRVGDGVMRTAISSAINLLSKQFVMAETLTEALASREQGFRYSFDCLGEAAQTPEEARHYLRLYQQALEYMANHQRNEQPLVERDSISIKLSALHPRYELARWPELKTILLPDLVHLVTFAAEAGIPITLDAEESERLEIGLCLFAELRMHPQLAGYEGLGIAVQAYQKRAPAVIDWLRDLSIRTGKRIPVRLVKGAYWDSEIKRAQQQGLEDYPVFTRKGHTDLCYLACARRLLKHPEHFHPQFATHNAHTLAWLEVVGRHHGQTFEVQRLCGMGEGLHTAYREACGRPLRIYAPIGDFNTLLPYLVRRLLENGSSQSFVNQMADMHIESRLLITDPVEILAAEQITPHPQIPRPPALFMPRLNSPGFSMYDVRRLTELKHEMTGFRVASWTAGLPPDGGDPEEMLAEPRHSPAERHRLLGTVHTHSEQDIPALFKSARQAFDTWSGVSVSDRAGCLLKMAELLIDNQPELLYLMMMEGGKTLADAQAEWREAIDLCRYYADQAVSLMSPSSLPSVAGEANTLRWAPRGVFLCLSPWNFPLAIFLGQVAAALVCGNTVITKAAGHTPLIAARTHALLLQAGIPADAVQLVLGSSRDIGQALLEQPALAGVVFTGSTATARHINLQLAKRPGPLTPLIAETGGLNAMIADSSALPEQLVSDVLQSAFNSAGQRCSALRILWLQEELKNPVLDRLEGALKSWRTGHPALLGTDMGPVIDYEALGKLRHYCAATAHKALWKAAGPAADPEHEGHYFPPQAFLLHPLDLPDQEVFGPVLHIATWKSGELGKVVNHINQGGYGLTLGVHSRIAGHIHEIEEHARVGNLYINRNQIGAVVGSQPFGGEGLSGTGFKAGGPHYLMRFCVERTVTENLSAIGLNPQLVMLEP